MMSQRLMLWYTWSISEVDELSHSNSVNAKWLTCIDIVATCKLINITLVLSINYNI